ncbi:hypothetical protein HK100_006810 [Physocladia obscura]|uniref:Helicase C-terminal domain-containing protein n=1 Tax=Physocladia obscura TaxID=109957 RepID=A0AAD5T6V1_9FUNG|nr:hypothetical protein HK100_006810 [Physocladia obscura]
MNINVLISLIKSNTILTEREGVDYLGHERQRKALKTAIDNLRRAHFYLFGAGILEHIEGSLLSANEALTKSLSGQKSFDITDLQTIVSYFQIAADKNSFYVKLQQHANSDVMYFVQGDGCQECFHQMTAGFWAGGTDGAKMAGRKKGIWMKNGEILELRKKIKLSLENANFTQFTLNLDNSRDSFRLSEDEITSYSISAQAVESKKRSSVNFFEPNNKKIFTIPEKSPHEAKIVKSKQTAQSASVSKATKKKNQSIQQNVVTTVNSTNYLKTPPQSHKKNSFTKDLTNSIVVEKGDESTDEDFFAGLPPPPVSVGHNVFFAVDQDFHDSDISTSTKTGRFCEQITPLDNGLLCDSCARKCWEGKNCANKSLALKITSTLSTKITYIGAQILKFYKTEKLIVFTTHWEEQHGVHQFCELFGIKHLSFAASGQSTIEKSMNVTTFNTSDNVRVFILNLADASHGLDLSSASRVFFLRPVPAYATYVQAIKRAHRVGCVAPVHVEVLVFENTIEERVGLDDIQNREERIKGGTKERMENLKMKDLIDVSPFVEYADSNSDESPCFDFNFFDIKE